MSKVKKNIYLLDFRLTLPFLIHKKIQYNIYVNLLYRLPILKPKLPQVSSSPIRSYNLLFFPTPPVNDSHAPPEAQKSNFH